jgi:hypothetical protein
MRPSPDTIPIRLAPIAGEAIDSWLEAYARRLRGTVHEVMALAGVPVPGRTALAGTPWTAGRHPEHFAALSVVSGLAVATLDAMTPAYYEGTLLKSAATHRKRGSSRWWPPGNGSRFCPRCLRENGGRWLLEWRLPWVFACLEHACLLLDLCPDCGHRPRDGWIFPREYAAAPGQCRSRITAPRVTRPAPRAVGRICGSSLPTAATAAVAADGLVMAAQRHLSGLLRDAVALGPETEEQPNPFLTRLDNIYTVARSALTARSRSANGTLPGLAHTLLVELGGAHRDVAQRTVIGPVRLEAGTGAFALSIATHTLSPGADRPDPEIMSWLARHEMHETDRGRAGPVVGRWSRATPELKHAVLRAVGPHLRPTEQLRYLTSTSAPRPPADGVTLLRAPMVPAVFWRGWALRLNPGRFATLPFRETLSTLLIQVGSADDYRAVHLALRRTPPQSSSSSSSWLTNALEKDGALRTVLQALSNLAIALDKHGCPIDYARRREMFASPELDLEFLRERFDAVGLRQPVEGELRHYRLRLAELLTGHPPQYAPDERGPALTPSETRTYENTIITKKPEVTDHLDAQALRLLAASGIDEPVQWEPPFTWIPPLDWPGPDPAEIDIDAMWSILRTGARPGKAAKYLGTSLEHVRIAALAHRDPDSTDHRSTYRRKIPRRNYPTEQELRQARDQGKTLNAIAEAGGYSRTVLYQVARNHGVEFKTGSGPSYQIDAQWLREQVEDDGRNFRQLAEELGVSEQRLGQLARTMGIMAPGRGGPSHRHPLTAHGGPSAFSPALWAAFKGQGAVVRVRRFLAIEGHTSLRSAAQSLGGIDQPTLHRQLVVLERDTGLDLFQRQGRQRTLTYSAAGRKLAAEARKALELIGRAESDRSRPSQPSGAITRLRPARTLPST